mgnify:CR=1 FL=1
MYILIISRGIPTAKEPQWGCFEQDQAEALQRAGHKVVVASIDSRFMMKWRKIGIVCCHKNNVDYYNSFWIPGSITRLLGSRFNISIKERQLDKIYKKIEKEHGKPDVIYSHFFFNTVLGVFLKNKYGIPLVGIEHAARFNSDKLDSFTKCNAEIAYKNANRIITVCETLKNRLEYHFGCDSTVVHNLVNPLFFQQGIISKKSSDIIQFVTTGSLVYRKGFDLLIKAVSLISHKNKSVKFRIIGDGEERNKLQKQINDSKLNNIVTLEGLKTKNEIISILSECDCFILPSRSENFSVAILEALALGLPVIATDCGGVKECINGNNGLLVPVDDEIALSKAITTMINNISSYNKEIIIEDCKSKFSPHAVALKLTRVFEEIV